MNGFFRGILFLFAIITAIIALIFLEGVYKWIRRKINKPKIGFENFSARTIKSGDYICINDRVMQFHHWTTDNEKIDPLMPPTEYNKTFRGNLAFYTNGLGYKILPSSSLKESNFIYGKYGLKWAASPKWSRVAEEKVQQYKRS